MRLKFTLLLFFITLSLSAQKAPNVVIFIADDVGWNDFATYGNQAITTPNIDKIAKQGVQFQNAFLTASSCSPSRISILTGRYPHNTGAPELHMPLVAGLPDLAGELQKAGYHTVSSGKWHQGEPMRSSFDVINSNRTGTLSTGDGGEANWLKCIEEKPQDKPFFMWFAAYDAHRSWGENEYSGTNKPNDVQVPPYMVNSEPTRQDFAQYYDEITRFDAFVGKVHTQLAKENLLENTIILIMADNGRPFPRCKTRLLDDGIKTPLIISWKGQFMEDVKTLSMVSSIDIMPTLLDLCDVKIPKTVQGKSFIEVLKKPSTSFRNFSFAEHNWHDYEAYGRMVRTKDYLYIYNGRAQYPQSTSADNHRDSSFQELVKTWRKGELTALQMDNFKAPRNFEELYDLQKDPTQLYDISKEPSYQKILLELREELRQWQEDTGDTEPTKLTPSGFDWLTGDIYQFMDLKTIRGEIPGSTKKAHLINNSGKF